MNQKSSYRNGVSIADVIARSSRKRGISVYVRTKMQPGQKYVLHCRTVFSNGHDSLAQAEYTRLIAETESLGWTLDKRTEGGSGISRTIPPPPQKDVPAPVAAPRLVRKTRKRA
jgi:hypothetical protein